MIWQPAATLLPSDAVGLEIWNQIVGGVLDVTHKDELNGSAINETQGSADDPDCCEWPLALPFRERRRGTGRAIDTSLVTLVWFIFPETSRSSPVFLIFLASLRHRKIWDSGIPPDVARVLEPNTLGYGFDDGPNRVPYACLETGTRGRQCSTSGIIFRLATSRHGALLWTGMRLVLVSASFSGTYFMMLTYISRNRALCHIIIASFFGCAVAIIGRI